jgi:hypothetical protein
LLKLGNQLQKPTGLSPFHGDATLTRVGESADVGADLDVGLLQQVLGVDLAAPFRADPAAGKAE